jgi:HAD superfamily hydrolase (TIGR01549 family)
MSRKGVAALFFDFDGVLVDSTAVKTNSYREIFKPYGTDVVTKVIAHHQVNAGISRVDKIDYAHKHILDVPYSSESVTRDVETYSNLVFEKVVQADWIPGAEWFVASQLGQVPLFIISGTPHEELLEIVRRRNMAHFFQEIHGSPPKKPARIRDIVSRHHLEIEACVFIGDALTDYDAARETGMDFIGIRSEVDFPEGTMVLPDCNDLAKTITRLRSSS